MFRFSQVTDWESHLAILRVEIMDDRVRFFLKFSILHFFVRVFILKKPFFGNLKIVKNFLNYSLRNCTILKKTRIVRTRTIFFFSFNFKFQILVLFKNPLFSSKSNPKSTDSRILKSLPRSEAI